MEILTNTCYYEYENIISENVLVLILTVVVLIWLCN